MIISSVYHLECECIDKKTNKPFIIITGEVEGTCPNCGRNFIVKWNKAKSVKERFYTLFGV